MQDNMNIERLIMSMLQAVADNCKPTEDTPKELPDLERGTGAVISSFENWQIQIVPIKADGEDFMMFKTSVAYNEDVE